MTESVPKHVLRAGGDIIERSRDFLFGKLFDQPEQLSRCTLVIPVYAAGSSSQAFAPRRA